ncbi:MAG: hypothetical protein WKG01_29380 [Kofleriaceae bacterium]
MGDHQKEHSKSHEREQAASTDVKDLTKISDDEAENMDEQSRKERSKKMPKDVHGRIVSVSVVDGKSKILIAGLTEGLKPGTEGYVKNGNGMLAKFTIAIHDHRTSMAYVDLTPDMLHDHSEVVLNPTSMPKASERRSDIKTRVVGVSVVTVDQRQRTKILLGIGTSHGARDDMQGFLTDESGKPFEHFEVTRAGSLSCEALVDATIDDVHRHTTVMLNPSREKH